MKIQEINNTLGPHQRETLVLRKGDVGGTVHFTVPDLTGITSADFRLIKPDGTFAVKSGAIVQNTVIVQITEQMCTVYGSGIYNLELKASGVSVYTAIGRCLIDKNIDLNDYAASVAEVNGLVFPDDFLSEDDLSNYVTETELSTALSNLPTVINYSTTEQNTGLKWIDGKPIYQKTIDFGRLPNASTKAVSTGVSDIESLINIDGVVRWSTGYQRSINSNNANTNALFIFGLDPDGYISCNTYMDRTDLTAIVTIQYTKTTDTV